jgi:exonuclease SbcD
LHLPSNWHKRSTCNHEVLSMTLRILHFADAHIDIANRGRIDPQNGLPIRVLDFLKALDSIVETAISERVDLVLFAGDAYKDRTPVPTFQREWGRRVARLSRARIPTLLLLGNHDLSPAAGRAHTLQEYETLEVPFVRVLNRPELLKPPDLWDLPLQVLAIPWVSRSALIALGEVEGAYSERIYERMQEILQKILTKLLENADPALPLILTAHASVEGAVYGGERTIMLGSDLVLPRGELLHPKVDYVALGHIHKHQNLNPDGYPAVIYPGSIERVDFGEAHDEKGFVIVHLERNATTWEWRPLPGRRFIDRRLDLSHLVPKSSGQPLPGAILEAIRNKLPEREALEGAIVRLTLEYPRDWETLIDETTLRQWLQPALEAHIIRRPQVDMRLRLADDEAIARLTPLELLDLYWRSRNLPAEEIQALQALAQQVISAAEATE